MLKFDVLNSKTVNEVDSDKRYVLYTVSVKSNGNSDANPSCIHRRYTQFLELFNSLKKDYPSLMSNLNFPKKVMMGNFDPALISNRSTGFGSLLDHIATESRLREAPSTIAFFQDMELTEAKKLIKENKYDQAMTILENLFTLLNKIYTDRSHVVLITLCRLVACGIGNSSGFSSNDIALAGPTERWAKLALHRFDGVSDTDLLSLYVPLTRACISIWKALGKDSKDLEDILNGMKKRGMRVDNCPNLNEAIDKLEIQSPNT